MAPDPIAYASFKQPEIRELANNDPVTAFPNRPPVSRPLLDAQIEF